MVITEPGGALGFRCAGVETMEVSAEGDVTTLVLGLAEGGRYGIIVVEESLASGIPEGVMRRIARAGLPIIVPVRLPRRWQEPEAGESPVARLIRKAIGYQIKIKR